MSATTDLPSCLKKVLKLRWAVFPKARFEKREKPKFEGGPHQTRDGVYSWELHLPTISRSVYVTSQRPPHALLPFILNNSNTSVARFSLTPSLLSFHLHPHPVFQSHPFCTSVARGLILKLEPPSSQIHKMYFSPALIATFFVIGALAGPMTRRDDDHDSAGCSTVSVQTLPPWIVAVFGVRRTPPCQVFPCHVNRRCPDTRGFDVTGVVTEVDLTLPQVKTECDCIQECLTSQRHAHHTPTSSPHQHPLNQVTAPALYTRTSDFNLPGDVTLEFDLNSANHVNVIAVQIVVNENNPHAGAPISQAFMDANLTHS